MIDCRRSTTSPAIPFPDNPVPRYPESLRLAGVQGAVVIQFVIDTSGRVELASLRVVRSDNEQFATAVRTVLPTLRFTPARIGDRAVRLFVEQPYEFLVR